MRLLTSGDTSWLVSHTFITWNSHRAFLYLIPLVKSGHSHLPRCPPSFQSLATKLPQNCSPKSIALILFSPRPYPLTWRNSLVNQVEFLGLASILHQCHLAMFKTFYAKPAQKRYGYLIMSRVKKSFGREVPHNYQSHNVIAQESQLCSPDSFSLGEAHGLGTRLVVILAIILQHNCCNLWFIIQLCAFGYSKPNMDQPSAFTRGSFEHSVWKAPEVCTCVSVCVNRTC